ncbi:MAG: TonB-dependent receptor plug domain-containing protein, partial [Alistipes sp.]|nr:TonB-dependent receptor plug domain-containing protein [Candidatus Minthomonas equi]
MLTVFLYCVLGVFTQQPDTLEGAVVHASFKGDTVNIQTVTSNRMLRSKVSSAKDVTALIPNFYQPDYGSHTTSSIYIRGFGSRMDQPAAGMYIDGIPIMNKSLYDFEFDGIRNVSLLRGPQGTLYGRNTSSGVMLVRTMSASEMAGMRASLEYSPVSAFKGSVSGGGKMGGKMLWGVSAFGRYYDGDFRFPDGSKADWSSSWGGRFRLEWTPSASLHLENIFSVGYVNEGGYAYRQMDESTGELLPLSYNDPSGYRRISIMDGLKADWMMQRTRWSVNISWQYLNDDMILDNDFTEESLFTMGQKQNEHSVTAEIMVKKRNEKSCWHPLTGAFLFGKFLSLDAPVLFKRDGIERLILDNANRGIRSVFPDAYLDIRENEFVIGNYFRIPTCGAALFHNSVWKVGNWTFDAGVRFDTEYASMDYDSSSSLNYLFSLSRKGWTPVSSRFNGTQTQSFFEVLPSFGVTHSFPGGSVYASVKKGYKAGGYNTQIFSDI